MMKARCEQCFWSGTIETEQEADGDRRAAETIEVDHCPVCGKWGLVIE